MKNVLKHTHTKKYWDFDSKEVKYIIRKIVYPTNGSQNCSENIDQDRARQAAERT